MPILTLRFKLPEEESEAEIAQKAGEYYSMLCDLRDLARRLDKYEERKNIPRQDVINYLRDILADFE